MRGRKNKIKLDRIDVLISPDVKPRCMSNFLSDCKNVSTSVNIKIYLKETENGETYDHLGYYDYLHDSYIVYRKSRTIHINKTKVDTKDILGYTYL